MTQVVVLNASYEPLQTVSLKHAIGMLWRGVATVHESAGDWLGPFPRPTVLRLVRYVYARWIRPGSAPYSKAGVHRRDGYTCIYCGGPATTVDHLVPRSRGGETSWTNCASCCEQCNRDKDSMTPDEAGMAPRFQPYVPDWSVAKSSR